MTDSVTAIPTAATSPAQTASGNGAAVSETSDTSTGGQFQSALLQQLQGLAAPTADALPGSSGTGTEVLKTLIGDDKPAADKTDQDGTGLPVTGQLLPLDPSQLASTQLPQVPPTGAELAAALLLTVNAAPAGGNNPAAPRLNLTPVADAVAQVTNAPAQNSRAQPEFFAALAPSHETLSAAHAALLTAEPPGTSSSSPLTAVPPATLNNVLANSAMPASANAAPASALPAISIPVAQPGWDQALGQRVQWLVGQHLQGAELRITPPHLGPIEVRISIGQDQQTVVNFASPHAAVRDAIEAAVPRLRDMLGNNGQDLVNVNVSQHSFAEQRRQSAPSGSARDNAYQGDFPNDALAVTSDTVVLGRSGSGLVDYFA